MVEIIISIVVLVFSLLGILVCGYIFQKEIEKKEKEIIKLNERINHLYDYNIKMLSLNDELLKDNQDLILNISLIKNEKEDSK